MDCRLIMIGEAGNESYSIKEGISTIGRDADNDIQLTGANISRHHAKIHNMAGVVEIEDMGSSNGTYVNGKKIMRERISHGNEIRMGRVYFLFEEVSSVGSDESQQSRDYSTRVKNETVKTKMNTKAPAEVKKAAGPLKPLSPLKPLKPLQPKQ